MTPSDMPAMTAEELADEVAGMRKAAADILASPSKRRKFLQRVGLPVAVAKTSRHIRIAAKK